MSDPKRNEWLSPGAIVGMVGLLAAAVATYSRVDGRIGIAEAQAQSLEKRLDTLDRKIDFLIQRELKPVG